MMKIRKDVIIRGHFCAISALTLALSISVARAETVTAEPDAFLEYVETNQDSSDSANVTQYIDTGVKAETGLKARMDAVILSTTRSDSAILGARKGSDNRFLMLHSNNKNAFTAYGYGATGKWNDTEKHPMGQRFEEVADFSDGTAIQIYINGRPRVSQAQQATIQSVAEDSNTGSISASWMNNLTLYLFAANNGGAAAWPCRIRLYELKILKKNGDGGFDVIRHYLPCIKNGRAGLYDKVNSTISYSYGSADFVAGSVLDKPLDFVKWIWGNNKQWFDTWVWGKSGLRSEVDVGVRDYDGDRAILASRGNDGTSANNTRLYMAYHHECAFRFAHGTLPGKSNINVVAPTNDVYSGALLDTRYLIKTDMTVGKQSMTIRCNGGEPVEILKDNVDYGSTFSTYLATTNTLYLLANHRYGTMTCSTRCVVYGTKIWDADELLRDFVPVVATNSTGVAYAGLYDTVSERIFRQIGTEEFNLSTQVGGVTNTLRAAANDRPDTRIEYIDSDGYYDYVDLGVIGKDGVEMETTMEWIYVPSDRSFCGARTTPGNPHVTVSGGSAKGGTMRFFPYHYWSSAHRIGYDEDLFSFDGGSATAGVKYRVKTRIDAGRGDTSISTFSNGAWSAPATRTILPGNGWDGPIDTGLPLFLFAINDDNLPRYNGNTRCYGLKLRVKRQNGSYELVRDLVPVKDPATGNPVFWDKVSEKYFRNGGKYCLAGGGAERPFEPGLLIFVR